MLKSLSLFDTHKETIIFDPGFSGTGFAVVKPKGKTIVVEAFGALPSIPKDANHNNAERIAVHASMIQNILSKYAKYGMQCVIEHPSFWETFKGLTSARAGSLVILCFSFATIATVAYMNKLKLFALPVQEWKGQTNKDITLLRVRRAIKSGMLSSVQQSASWGTDPTRNQHIVDCLGMALKIYKEEEK